MFLVATYVFWAIGLRANLAANWSLLEATGTSTNVLSKAAYDVTSRALPGVLIFLGGANLGAAAYEYGLARLTRAFLRLRAAAKVEASTTQP